MAVNTVIYGGNTIMDISDSTVTEDTLLEGVVAYNSAGERIVGKVVTANLDTTLSIEGAAAEAKAVGDKIASMHMASLITLTAGGWSNNQQTIAVNGVTATNIVVVAPAPAKDNYTAYVESNVRCIEQTNGSLTFECDEVPSIDILVTVAVYA